VVGLFGLQKNNFVLTTIAHPVINMGILDNLEYSMSNGDGVPNETVIDTTQEMTEDPEYNKLMERLKYMEEHGI
jgi:hypothetical protein